MGDMSIRGTAKPAASQRSAPAEASQAAPAVVRHEDGFRRASDVKLIKPEAGKDSAYFHFDLADGPDDVVALFGGEAPEARAKFREALVEANGGKLAFVFKRMLSKLGFKPLVKVPLLSTRFDSEGQVEALTQVLVNKAFYGGKKDDLEIATMRYALGPAMLPGTTMNLQVDIKDPQAPGGVAQYLIIEAAATGTFQVMTRAAAEKHFPSADERVRIFNSWWGD